MVLLLTEYFLFLFVGIVSPAFRRPRFRRRRPRRGWYAFDPLYGKYSPLIISPSFHKILIWIKLNISFKFIWKARSMYNVQIFFVMKCLEKNVVKFISVQEFFPLNIYNIHLSFYYLLMVFRYTVVDYIETFSIYGKIFLVKS